MKMKNIYYVEVTDTYGGESNYSWCVRFKVHASTMRGAMRKVEQRSPYAGGVSKTWDDGTVQRWDWREAAVCAFVEDYVDQAEHKFSVTSI